MNIQIIIVLLLVMVINIIATFAYPIRLVGVETGKLAVSLAIFNVLNIVSRVAMTFQVPFLVKYIETSSGRDVLNILIYVFIATAIASAAAGFLTPTFMRIMKRMVNSFSVKRSFSKIIYNSISATGFHLLKQTIVSPTMDKISSIEWGRLPYKMLVVNALCNAVLFAGSIASIYAGYLEPSLRMTCFSLAPAITGGASVILTVVVDPYLSLLTDDVIAQKYSYHQFQGSITGMMISRSLGALLSILLLIPAAYAIIFIARLI